MFIFSGKRFVLLSVLVLACNHAADAKANPRAMSQGQYTAYLQQLDLALPIWEEQLQRLDTDKIANMPYKDGKFIMDQKELAMHEINDVRNWIRQEHASPRASHQLMMAIGLGSILDDFENLASLLLQTPWSDGAQSLFPQISGFRLRLLNHMLAGVEALELRHCK